MDLKTTLLSKQVKLSDDGTTLIPLEHSTLSYSIGASGYIMVRINSTTYALHRVLVALREGKWPIIVDHRDRDILNNTEQNLRSCTSSDNNCNRGMRSDNTIGYKGIFIRDTKKKGRVYGWMIKYAGRAISKSGFLTPEAAFEDRKRNLIIAHGEFYNDGT